MVVSFVKLYFVLALARQSEITVTIISELYNPYAKTTWGISIRVTFALRRVLRIQVSVESLLPFDHLFVCLEDKEISMVGCKVKGREFTFVPGTQSCQAPLPSHLAHISLKLLLIRRPLRQTNLSQAGYG